MLLSPDAYQSLLTIQTISYQNLNSGNLRIKGLNSSLDLVGNDGPSSKIEVNDYIFIKEIKSNLFHLLQ